MKIWICYFRASTVAFTNGTLVVLFHQGLRMPWKIGESSAGKLPRRTAAANHKSWKKPSQNPPAKEDTKVSSARKVLNIQYSQARGKRADSRSETDGCGCTEQFHFSYFLLFRVLFVGSRRREGEREKGWSRADIFYRRCVWHSARFHHIPPALIAISRRQFSGPYESSCKRFRGATQEG